MNKLNFLILCVLLLFVLNGVTLYFLFTGNNRNVPAQRPGFDFIIRQLKFDEQQKQQFEGLRNQHRAELDVLKKQDRELHHELLKMIQAGNADAAKVDSLTALIGNNKAAFDRAFYRHFSEVRKICKPGQLTLFNETVEQIVKRPPPREQGPPQVPPPGSE